MQHDWRHDDNFGMVCRNCNRARGLATVDSDCEPEQRAASQPSGNPGEVEQPPAPGDPLLGALSGRDNWDHVKVGRKEFAEMVQACKRLRELEQPRQGAADGREVLLEEASRLLRNHVAGENVDDLMHYWADKWDLLEENRRA